MPQATPKRCGPGRACRRPIRLPRRIFARAARSAAVRSRVVGWLGTRRCGRKIPESIECALGADFNRAAVNSFGGLPTARAALEKDMPVCFWGLQAVRVSEPNRNISLRQTSSSYVGRFSSAPCGAPRCLGKERSSPHYVLHRCFF